MIADLLDFVTVQMITPILQPHFFILHYSISIWYHIHTCKRKYDDRSSNRIVWLIYIYNLIVQFRHGCCKGSRESRITIWETFQTCQDCEIRRIMKHVNERTPSHSVFNKFKMIVYLIIFNNYDRFLFSSE